jgi:hypothetical protein
MEREEAERENGKARDGERREHLHNFPLEEKLVTYTVWVMEKRHLLDGTSVPLAKTALWEHVC